MNNFLHSVFLRALRASVLFFFTTETRSAQMFTEARLTDFNPS
jgi:hypothetical protein